MITVYEGQNKNIKLKKPIINYAIITITADSETEVFIDDTLASKGTWSGKLEKGKHKIACAKENCNIASKEIEVRVSQDEKYTLTPEPLYEKISVKSRPQGAIIYIDENYFGETPQDITLGVGEHTIKLKKEHRKSVVSKINIAPNFPRTLKYHLPYHFSINVDLIYKLWPVALILIGVIIRPCKKSIAKIIAVAIIIISSVIWYFSTNNNYYYSGNEEIIEIIDKDNK